MTSIGCGFIVFAVQVIYYGTTLNLNHIGYSQFVNQQIIGISQGLGYFAAQIFISKVPRKKWSIIGLGGSAILCLVLGIFNAFQTDSNYQIFKFFQTIGLIANRFVLCAFCALFFVYLAELYPTKVRSIGFGWAGAMGTIGSTFAPYMLFFSTKIGINSWVPPGIIGLICLAFVLVLKETFGKPSYDQIEEVRQKPKQITETRETETDC